MRNPWVQPLRGHASLRIVSMSEDTSSGFADQSVVYCVDHDDCRLNRPLAIRCAIERQLIPCNTYGCMAGKRVGSIFCRDCREEYNADPDAFK
jgi:hypothetical protein